MDGTAGESGQLPIGAPDAADDWSRPPRTPPAGDDGALIVDVDGFEGPLDLLLALARTQKVDLARISILALVEQYIAFVERVGAERLERAADHLVMAAWLAYLKSRLLLPAPPQDDEPTGEQLAAELAFRLRRLEAMRERAQALMARDRLGVTVFGRGAPEPVAVVERSRWQASLWDLLSAYASQRQRTMVTEVRVGGRTVWSLVEAREILERLIGPLAEWTPLERLLADRVPAELRATALASTFSASLELVREGRLEISQTGAFAPLLVRAKDASEIPGEIPGEAEGGARPDDGTGDAEETR